MTEIAKTLPFELANFIYSFVGVHPVAQIIKDHFDRDDPEMCIKCRMYEKYDDGYCEYCYAEVLGTDVYTCGCCGDKTFIYGRHNNIEGGLYCDGCMETRDEDGMPLSLEDL
jgi:hypothetical protein